MQAPDVQFAYARRRCRKCDWPSIVVCMGGVGKGGYRFQCRSCGSKHTYIRKNQLLKWIFKLTFYSILIQRPVTKRRHLLTALGVLATKGIHMPEVREMIVRKAGLI